jgi:hypothetical protein
MEENAIALPQGSMVHQLQALKSDAVDIKIAEMERQFRSDIEIYTNKRKQASQKIDVFNDKLEEAVKGVRGKTCRDDNEELVEKLNELFGTSYDFDDVFEDYSYMLYTFDKEEDTLTFTFRTKVSIGGYSDERYDIEIKDITTDYPEVLALNNEKMGCHSEMGALSELINDRKKKLEDFDFLERQVKAEVSKQVFKELGIEEVLKTISDKDYFAIEGPKEEDENPASYTIDAEPYGG